jgi:hypothetical protein
MLAVGDKPGYARIANSGPRSEAGLCVADGLRNQRTSGEAIYTVL